MNVEPPETLVSIESIVYKSNGFAIESQRVKVFNVLVSQCSSSVRVKNSIVQVRQTVKQFFQY